MEKFTNANAYLGKTVKIKIDRPLGSTHPNHKNIKFDINYGYVPNTKSPDGEELDAYLFGEDQPVEEAEGKVVAVIHRTNDDDDKLIVSKTGKDYTDQEIDEQTYFQEKYFKHEIIRP